MQAYLGVSILQPHACTQRFRLRILRRMRSNAGRTSARSLSGRIEKRPLNRKATRDLRQLPGPHPPQPRPPGPGVLHLTGDKLRAAGGGRAERAARRLHGLQRKVAPVRSIGSGGCLSEMRV